MRLLCLNCLIFCSPNFLIPPSPPRISVTHFASPGLPLDAPVDELSPRRLDETTKTPRRKMWFKTIQQDLKSKSLPEQRGSIWLRTDQSAEIVVYVWSHALLVVHTTKDEMCTHLRSQEERCVALISHKSFYDVLTFLFCPDRTFKSAHLVTLHRKTM